MSSQLRITEVFHSLQGEAASVGRPTVFVRLTGCPLRCHYCDSEYAFYGGSKRDISSLLDEVDSYACKYVCVTGGEPLAQPESHSLLSALCDAGYSVSLETSGAMSVGDVDQRVSIVMDLKTPGSGEVEKNRYSNIGLLSEKDQIKFVVCSESDYQWAMFKLDEYGLQDVVGDVLFSPSFGSVDPKLLAQWILRDKLQVRFQMQLHKILWGDVAGV